jgi:hypothetical protein
MRSLTLITLLGSFIASTSLVGQSLTEHAAAAAGATIGTAAGKPLGGALGKVFGEVEKTPSAAPRTVKPTPAKPEPSGPPKATEHPSAAADASGGGGGGGGSVAAGAAGGEAAAAGSTDTAKTARSHRASNRKNLPAPPPAAPIVAEPVVTAPVIKEPSAQDVAGIRVGATSSELRQALGTPESTISIPAEDGHLLEIRQYWANGEPVGTVRLDNGRVVSVRPNN